MPKYGEKLRPRLLIQGYGEDIRTALLEFIPTVRIIESVDDVRQEEGDALLTNEDVDRVSDHLYIVAVGSSSFGRCGFIDAGGHRSSVPISWFGYSNATEFEVPDELPLRLSRLVHEVLLPLAEKSDRHLFLDHGAQWAPPGHKLIEPLLETTEPRVLAGRFLRQGRSSWCWALPNVEDPVPWTLLAIEEWSQLDTTRFPSMPNWRHHPQWQTEPESKISAKLERIRKRYDDLLSDLKRETEAVEKQLDAVRQAADAGERRLLTERGTALVEAVMNCFQVLGFDVTDMDKLTEERDRREDLRVAVPDRPGWTALVEVRGYKRGAQINDLQRIGGRFRRRYLQETGRDADKVWYVVNQFLGEEPDGRPLVFSNNQRDLETFAEDDGLVIDAVDLFRLLFAVRQQKVEAGFARNKLVDATGRFDLATVLSKPAQIEEADGTVG